jgi:hypothetical protein
MAEMIGKSSFGFRNDHRDAYSQTYQKNMTLQKSFLAILISLTLTGVSGALAESEQPPTPARAKAKARPRFFNPFDVKRSRLKIDRFGFFTFLPSGSLLEAPVEAQSSTAQPAPKVVSPQPGQSSLTTSDIGSATGTGMTLAPSTVVSQPSVVSNDNTTPAGSAAVARSGSAEGSVSALLFAPARPPFRPPVRSPFRPPPRPPF